ncbi:hypothetical protein COO60DRAFT_1500163 [Scenedesmus sp. NREL 46B-D3]|nr:hypothetical protein COO60DRAFT_1500163 [Scenedesmus sp. NREL 46B-D3]
MNALRTLLMQACAAAAATAATGLQAVATADVPAHASATHLAFKVVAVKVALIVLSQRLLVAEVCAGCAAVEASLTVCCHSVPVFAARQRADNRNRWSQVQAERHQRQLGATHNRVGTKRV